MNEFQGLEYAEISDRMNEVAMAELSACNLNVSTDTLKDPSQTAWEVARLETEFVYGLILIIPHHPEGIERYGVLSKVA